MKLIHNSNGRINEMVLDFSINLIDSKEIYKKICLEHVELQQQVAQLLGGASPSTQQQATKFDDL